ncbi:MAG TPA: DUF2934 domain-containing protein [Vicinamibacterales bacterium]|nr:DUF2934 domain-containing protein [Vicinamibacterales bacterium]
MAKRVPSSQPRARRTRGPADEAPAQAADTAIAGTADTMDEVSAADTGPTEEEIRERAYHRYLERGAGHGQDFDDWLEAERELRNGKRG